MTVATGRTTRVIGWYHSHPHITVLPSHVDVRTQAMYQLLDTGFIGLIFSCFSEDALKVGRIQVIAFQSLDGKQKHIPRPVSVSPVHGSSVIEVESSFSSSEVASERSGSSRVDSLEQDTGDSRSTAGGTKGGRKAADLEGFFTHANVNYIGKEKMDISQNAIDDIDSMDMTASMQEAMHRSNLDMSGAEYIRKEIPLQVMPTLSLLKLDTPLTSFMELQRVLFEEERAAYNQAILQNMQDGKVHPLAFIHHTSTYQASMCKLMEYCLSPAISVLQDRLRENEIRLAMLTEEAKTLEIEAFSGSQSSMESPRNLKAYGFRSGGAHMGQRDLYSPAESSGLRNPVGLGSQSWISDLSCRSSISACSNADHSLSSAGVQKPHKANQVAWEAMKRLRGEKGRVGLDHFRLLRRLGSGDIGNVYLCQLRSPPVGLPECLYAMKVVDREALAFRKKLQRAEMEKEILGILDHPFLPTLYAEFDASHYSCLVMEFCPGGDLHATRQRQPGKRFSFSSARFYGAETLLALEYLHMMGVVYRDLKPENVLVREDGHIMLSDFDLSLRCVVVPKILKTKLDPQDYSQDKDETCSLHSCAAPMKPVLSCFSSPTKKEEIMATVKVDLQNIDTELVAEPINARSKSFVGTHEYLAPEVISGTGHGSAVDWWTLGVFLYELLYGRTPFKGENNEKTLINIIKQPLIFPRICVSSSKEFEDMLKVQDLISKLLVKNPKKRLGSSKGSVEIKRHEFFKGVNWALIRSVRPPEVPGDLLKNRSKASIPKLTKKEREATYQIPHSFDYF
ncbi:hypothetical protein NE237_027586 [Protea cynaroides]|uniref:non-specific serine/threonine protein kinase n=1 Tax=Protea cynaroides TaxID=273540 RepID=A0A9Q0GS59_9MAGN|nr:hypothetical protein NE237_027586 [Protea cynaroides]